MIAGTTAGRALVDDDCARRRWPSSHATDPPAQLPLSLPVTTTRTITPINLVVLVCSARPSPQIGNSRRQQPGRICRVRSFKRLLFRPTLGTLTLLAIPFNFSWPASVQVSCRLCSGSHGRRQRRPVPLRLNRMHSADALQLAVWSSKSVMRFTATIVFAAGFLVAQITDPRVATWNAHRRANNAIYE